MDAPSPLGRGAPRARGLTRHILVHKEAGEKTGFRLQDGSNVVSDVFQGSPAARAGMCVHDTITSVNGSATKLPGSAANQLKHAAELGLAACTFEVSRAANGACDTCEGDTADSSSKKRRRSPREPPANNAPDPSPACAKPAGAFVCLDDSSVALTLRDHLFSAGVDVRADLCALLERGDNDTIALLSKIYRSADDAGVRIDI